MHEGDPVAIDQACIDLVAASDDPGKDVYKRQGTYCLYSGGDEKFGLANV